MRRLLGSLIMIPFLGGCAFLHKVQLSDIDNRSELTPFEIKVSETGVDINEAVRLQRALFKDSKTMNDAGDIAGIVALFQQGPVTGAPVYKKDYAEKIVHAIHQSCQGGRITGLTSIRETRKYPVISGEIVKIKGYCMKERVPASAEDAEEM